MKRILENSRNNLISDEEDERRRKLAEDEEKRERFYKAKALFGESGVPERHRNFQIPESGLWLEAFESLKQKIGTGFIQAILGPRGTGKTQIATSIIKSMCCENLDPAYYSKAIDIFIMLRESFRKDGDSESRVIKNFVTPKLLVIDAMEERGETPFEDRLLNHIIDKRYDAMLDTILISNQTADIFAKTVGPSIISRIHETGGKTVCDWPSFRTVKG